LFNEVNEQVYKIATSSLLEAELENAPTHVRNFLDQIPESNRIEVTYTGEAIELADKYIEEGIVCPTSLTDCRHIATATVNKINILAS